MLNPKHGVAVFSDGSSYHKDRSGGWAWLAIDASNKTVSRSGATSNTTNNQMELHAPTEALNWLYDNYGPIEVLIYSDSEYAILGSQNKKRKRRVNQDFWDRLDEAIDRHTHVEWQHVKGHSGHKHNELVDKMAGEARKNGRTD